MLRRWRAFAAFCTITYSPLPQLYCPDQCTHKPHQISKHVTPWACRNSWQWSNTTFPSMPEALCINRKFWFHDNTAGRISLQNTERLISVATDFFPIIPHVQGRNSSRLLQNYPSYFYQKFKWKLPDEVTFRWYLHRIVPDFVRESTAAGI